MGQTRESWGKNRPRTRQSLISFYSSLYRGTPPWDIGRPQKEIVNLSEEGLLYGSILDVGCGSGANALYLASKGHHVSGLDSCRKAIEKARKDASLRDLGVRFILGNALDPFPLKHIDTLIDSAVYHIFSDQDRNKYRNNIHEALKPGGRYIQLIFSENEPWEWGGPRRVERSEIQKAFRKNWRIEEIRDARFESKNDKKGRRAWLSIIRRI